MFFKIILIIFLNTYSYLLIANDTLRVVENKAFTYGEELNYVVSYGYLTAGKGSIHIKKEPILRNNRKSYDIWFKARTTGILSWIYTLKDSYRIIVDEKGLFPWEAEQKIREGSYKRDFKAEFNHFNKEVYVEKDTFNIEPYTHSLFSAFYYFRTLDLTNLKKDDVTELRFFYKDTTLTTKIKIIGIETIEVDSGKFECIIIQPEYVKGGLFRSKVTPKIWLSNDEKKIPIKVEAEVNIIGDAYVELTSYKGIPGIIKSKK